MHLWESHHLAAAAGLESVWLGPIHNQMFYYVHAEAAGEIWPRLRPCVMSTFKTSCGTRWAPLRRHVDLVRNSFFFNLNLRRGEEQNTFNSTTVSCGRRRSNHMTLSAELERSGSPPPRVLKSSFFGGNELALSSITL